MDEGRTLGKSHKMILYNRKSLSLTGIIDAISFDLNEVLLETELGMLHINGKDLRVNRLSLEKGEVELEGVFDSMTYSETNSFEARKQGVFGRLFG